MFIEPVFGERFFGREEVLGTLQKRVTALKGGYRQNLALTGPMLAGKSSILRHFLKNINDPKVIPLYIEMGEDDFPVFCTRFMATLLYRYLISESHNGEGDFEALKNACREKMPETVNCIDIICGDLEQKKEDAAYEKLLALTSVFKIETGKNCIVILDEFHNLSNFRLKRPFHTFGKYIMIQKNTMYIVSSSQETLLREILSKKLALLFGNFEVIEINGFDNETAMSFISEKIGNDDMDENIRNYMIQLSQGSPFYIEVLSSRFLKRKEENPQKDPAECLLDAFSDVLYESNGMLNQYFTNNINFFMEKKARKKFITILVSLASGNSTVNAIHDDFGKIDKNLGPELQKLQNLDLIYNSGVFYKISDKLFEYWLKYVYALRMRSMIDDMDIRYLEFKQSIADDFRQYCEFCKKPVIEAVCGLFGKFRNEKIKINMNFRKMPPFDSVQDRSLSKNLFEITGRIKDKKWVCHLKQEDMVDEQDVMRLLGLKSGEGSEKIVRKILIPLKDIEQNAFLLAKEHNVWIWDIQQLNRIFRLYEKFELVL
ncbi:MAG: ATP-binding protein [Candidatus Omnitrophota bacterium]